MVAIWIIVPIIAISLVYVLFLSLEGYWYARRQHTVTCPDNAEAVQVRADGKRGISVVFGGQRQRVVECTRWPEKRGCDRDCESQL